MLINDNQYLSVIESSKTEISKAQYNAALQVNKELTLLYYHIGRTINEHKSWGNKFIDNLARDIKIAYPNSTGYSVRNLKYMAKFAAEYWNDYQTLLIYAPSHPTIVYGLFKVMTDSSGSSVRGQVPVQMAGCTLVTVPVIMLFIIFRNKLMGNLTIGGVKE